MIQLRFLVAAMLLAASPSAAQVRTGASLSDPALDALVAEALANAPELTSARANVDAARLRVVPAETLPDPFISTAYQNDGSSISLGDAEGSFIELMASQPFPWPGKRELAGRIAASEALELETGTAARARMTIDARVRSAWYDLVLTRANVHILDHHASSATQIESSVRERYAAGLSVQQDVLRAQLELARIEEQRAALDAQIIARSAELNRLLGRPLDAPIETPRELPDVEALPATDDLIAFVLERSPELAETRQAIETGRIRVDLARKDFRPDLVVNGGWMYRAGFEMGPMWQVGVGLSLPVWSNRRQKNVLAEAQARTNASEADAGAVRLELELRTRERIAQLEAAVRVARLYRDRILPLDALSLESALASYQAGKVPFITVIEALDAEYNDRAAHAARLADCAKLRVAIDEARLEAVPMSAAETRNQKPETRMGTSGTAMSGAASSASMGSMK